VGAWVPALVLVPVLVVVPVRMVISVSLSQWVVHCTRAWTGARLLTPVRWPGCVRAGALAS
jgi:hypothetical protein